MIKTIIALVVMMASCSVVKASSANEVHKLENHVEDIYATTIISNKGMIFNCKKDENVNGKKEDTQKARDTYKRWSDILKSADK